MSNPFLDDPALKLKLFAIVTVKLTLTYPCPNFNPVACRSGGHKEMATRFEYTPSGQWRIVQVRMLHRKKIN